MLVSDFAYELPQELIARYPAAERDASRLMLLDRRTGSLSGTRFSEIVSMLSPGDLMVLNDTRVLAARVLGARPTGGRVELFLVSRLPGPAELWECLVKGSKRFRPGQQILLPAGAVATVIDKQPGDVWLVRFDCPEPFEDWLEREGHIPLPPYLHRADEPLDRDRYQTVFAREAGAVAAPTAGLHFTGELLQKIADRGVGISWITLHTGPGTFQPVRVERVEDHRIHAERYLLPESTADAISAARRRGGRVIAVGTTSARTLEYCADGQGGVVAGSGLADIFIRPGYDFRVVDGLVTNFHLPESTLLMLVSAFAGRDFVLEAYRQAVRDGYRFYSYGDAMMIV